MPSGDQEVAWIIDQAGPYRISAIHGGILAGYTANSGSNNLIVKNIMMNDVRNHIEYECVIVPGQGTLTLANIIKKGDSTILYVAGE